MECLELPNSYILEDQKTNSTSEHCLMEPQRKADIFTNSRVSEHVSGSHPDLLVMPPLFGEGNLMDISGSRYENGLFSSSLSDIFNKKSVKLSSSIVPLVQPVNSVNSNFGEDDPLESMEEIEAQTIGNLLPDDEELLSGVLDDIGFIGRSNNANDIDDDIFYSIGGIEIESDNNNNGNKTSEFVGRGAYTGQQGASGGPFSGEHPYGEHPSRTLFVRNINSNVEDSELRALFERYGEIHTLYTACKHRGFVMISYYDIRAACNAMQALQNKPLRRRNLDIHFSIPKDNPSEKETNQGTLLIFSNDSTVTNDNLHQIFGIYGEIKEIREAPHKHQHKFIDFFDVRAAEAVLHVLNRSDIAGKKIKIVPSQPGGSRSSKQLLFSEVEQEELNAKWHGSPNSLLGFSGLTFGGAITNNSLKNGVSQGLHPAAKIPSAPLMEATFHAISSSVPQHLSSPVRIASVGNHTNQASHADISHSLGQMNFGFHGMHGFQPHSLPNYQNGITNCIPYKSNTMGIGVISRPSEGTDNSHLQKVGSDSFNGHSFDPNNALGVSLNGNCLLHGYAWNNTNAFHHKHTSWSNSPTFVGKVPGHQLSQIHGIPGAQSRMLNSVLPLHQHDGSAPAISPSLWDRRHACAGNSMESPVFHPGSLGSLGLSSIPHLESLELASCNFFSHSGGNCLDPCISPAHVGIPSPQQRGQMFHGRNPMIPIPASFDSPTDRMRSRRNDANANQADNRKQYELDIERIKCGEDRRTTLMIKNIPNKYTSKMLLAAIDENHRGTYDFIYLPIDFKNKCNVGYAFINMTNPQHIIPFYQSFNGKKWEKFNSEKVASLAYARIQGKAALVSHFQNSSLMNEDKRCRPILFHTDGPNAGDQEPFPVGSNIRSRSGRSRIMSGSEENQPGAMSTLAIGEATDGVGSSPGSTKDSELPKPPS